MRKIAAFCALTAIVGACGFGLTGCERKDARSKYAIEAEYFSTEGRLEGNATITLPNRTQNVLKEIPLALYANAFCEGAETPPVSELFSSACYYDGESYGKIEIGEVTGGKDWSVAGIDRSVLKVNLDEPLYPDESVTLNIKYTLFLAKANHRLGIGERCVNLSYFYPLLFAQGESGFYEYLPARYGEPFVLDCADFEVALTVPSGMGVACGGRIEKEEEGDGKTRYRYAAEGVRDAAFVLGEFSLSSAEREGVRIDYYYFADESPQDTLNAAGDAIKTYSELFGAYPYSRYAIAESDLYFGGMEYCGFATIASALKKERVFVVAHETAHQWWYASIGSNQAECAWQDEGLAEYSVALFFERNSKYGVNYKDIVSLSERAYRNYFSVKSQLSDQPNTGMSRPLNDFSGDYEYRVLSYDKGVILLDRLRGTTGDRRFFFTLKNYAKDYAGRLASEYDFISRFPSEEELILSFIEGRCVI